MRSVFLVDNSKFMRFIIKSVLEKNGIYVSGEADNWEEAQIKLKKTNSDIIIFGLVLGDFKEIQMVKEMKKLNSNLKIIACSFINKKTTMLEFFSEGISAYIVKPFTENKFLKEIENIF